MHTLEIGGYKVTEIEENERWTRETAIVFFFYCSL